MTRITENYVIEKMTFLCLKKWHGSQKMTLCLITKNYDVPLPKKVTRITENGVMLNNLRWNWITLRKFWIAQTCLHDILELIRWRYKFWCEAEKWWVFWRVQQQHCYLWKNSAKWTALTLDKISTKIMRSGAIWSPNECNEIPTFEQNLWLWKLPYK